MTNPLTKLAIAAAAAFASTSLIHASAMADTQSAKSSEVRFGDLDLTTRPGAAALERRVRAAARQVCDFRADQRALRSAAEEAQCRAEAEARAEPAVAAAIARARLRMAGTVNSSVARP